MSGESRVRQLIDVVRILLLVGFALQGTLNVVAIGWGPWNFPIAPTTATIAYEQSPWTWLSVALLLTTATAVWSSTRGRDDRRWWSFVSLLFVYLAADEGLQLHERLGDLDRFSTEHYGWATAGAAIAAAVALPFAWHLRRIEPSTRWRLLVGGALYVGGALGVEVLAGLWQTEYGDDRGFFLITTVEETLEVLGPLVVLAAVRSLPVVTADVAATPAT